MTCSFLTPNLHRVVCKDMFQSQSEAQPFYATDTGQSWIKNALSNDLPMYTLLATIILSTFLCLSQLACTTFFTWCSYSLLLWTADPNLRVVVFNDYFSICISEAVKAKLCFRFSPCVTYKNMLKNIKVAGWCISICHHIPGGYSIVITNCHIKILVMSSFLIVIFIGVIIWHY